jgi:hypothetical protein
VEKSGSEKEPAKKEATAKDRRVGTPHYVALGLAVVGVLLLWLLLSSGGDDSGEDETESGGGSTPAVQVVSESELLEAMEGVGYPVYWAGPRLGVQYEVSRPEDGRAFVRYLPKGEEAESEEAFLTVGSYQQLDALASIRELGQKPGAILVQIAGGGSAYADGADATSAYLAFPGVETQVEVYDPQPGRALSLVRSGAIVPIG